MFELERNHKYDKKNYVKLLSLTIRLFINCSLDFFCRNFFFFETLVEFYNFNLDKYNWIDFTSFKKGCKSYKKISL